MLNIMLKKNLEENNIIPRIYRYKILKIIGNFSLVKQNVLYNRKAKKTSLRR